MAAWRRVQRVIADTHEPTDSHPLEVADGIHWVRLPLPIQLNHVNCWLLEDEHELVIIDTGFDSPTLRAIWQGVLTTRLGRRQLRVVATHYHPDHVGLAGWLVREHGAELLMSEREWLIYQSLARLGDDAYSNGQRAFFALHGMDVASLDVQQGRGNAYARGCAPPPVSYTRLSEGESIRLAGREWQVMTGRGHSMEQVALLDAEADLLLIADQVLMRITPNISTYGYNPGASPLSEYLIDLAKLEALGENMVALPGHHRIFHPNQGRIADIRAHHDERLEQCIAWCTEPQPAFALLPSMFPRKLDPHQQMFALGELIAHLDCLVDREALSRTAHDGVLHYQRR